MASAQPTQATTLEQQLVEIVNRVQVVERNSDLNPNNSDFVNGTFDSNTGIFTAQVRIPCEVTIGANGETGYVAVPYLNDPE